jgi:PhnB protein
MVEAIPQGFGTITPHIILKNAIAAIEFYRKAFGAEALSVLKTPDGRVMHADLKIGDSHLFICDEFPEAGCGGASPQTLGDSHAVIHLYVKDCDKAFAKAIEAGAKETMKPWDSFWGDRYAKVEDPFGQPWSIATHIKDLTEKEIEEGAKACMEQAAACAK